MTLAIAAQTHIYVHLRRAKTCTWYVSCSPSLGRVTSERNVQPSYRIIETSWLFRDKIFMRARNACSPVIMSRWLTTSSTSSFASTTLTFARNLLPASAYGHVRMKIPSSTSRFCSNFLTKLCEYPTLMLDRDNSITRNSITRTACSTAAVDCCRPRTSNRLLLMRWN